jgi:ATP-dependent Clp protease ATP-binding subunit ClpC
MAPAETRMPLHIREAERLGHNYIGCEHLLLGILADEEDPGAKVLVAHGVTLETARRRVGLIVGDGPRDAVRWRYSPRAIVVGKLAEVEAERLGELHPQHGHMLLAMITEGAGVPMALLKERGVDLEKLREDLLDALDAPSDLRANYLSQRTAVERERTRGPRAPS